MTNQEKKAWLQRYQDLDRQIGSQCDELAMWRSRAAKVTPTYSDMPRGYTEDRVQDAVDNICRIEDELNADIDRLVDLRAQILMAIDNVDNELYRAVLEMRYIRGWSLERIAVERNYCYRSAKRIHGKALEKLSPNVPS